MERLEKLERVRSLAREVRASGYFDPIMEIRDVMTENGVPFCKCAGNVRFALELLEETNKPLKREACLFIKYGKLFFQIFACFLINTFGRKFPFAAVVNTQAFNPNLIAFFVEV